MIINLSNSYLRKGVTDLEIIKSNIIDPILLLQTVISSNVSKWINISSALNPNTNIYSISKSTFSNYSQKVSDLHNFNFIDLKVELFYGPNQPVDNFIPSMFQKMKNGETVYLTSGKQLRDIIYVDDVMRSIDLALSYNKDHYSKHHIASGDLHSIKETVLFIHELCKSNSILKFDSLPNRDPMKDEEKAYDTDLEFHPFYGWKSGLEHYYDSLLN